MLKTGTIKEAFLNCISSVRSSVTSGF